MNQALNNWKELRESAKLGLRETARLAKISPTHLSQIERGRDIPTVTPTADILVGDALEMLRALPGASVDCIVTSPPYWGLRDYGVDGQIGLEPTFAEFLNRLDAVFAECYRVLKPTGTMWVNMGDSYSHSGGRGNNVGIQATHKGSTSKPKRRYGSGVCLPEKSLIGQPWRVAFMLQDAGWTLRSEIIWHKPNPMPESVKDRPTRAHEQIFLLTKSPRYYYNADAIAEPTTGNAHSRGSGVSPKAVSGRAAGPGNHCTAAHNRKEISHAGPNSKFHKTHVGAKPQSRQNESFSAAVKGLVDIRNARTIWSIASEPFSGAHYATFPTEIPRRCISAGCPPGGTVLDPFAGTGTTLAVAAALGCNSIGIELNPEYAELIRKRLAETTPMLPFHIQGNTE